jgi:Na+/H+ antiporter NhaC
MKDTEIINLEDNKKLAMYGGLWGGLMPLLILVGVLIWLSFAERGTPRAFWAGGWLAVAAGLFFAKNKEDYCGAVMRGLGDKNGIIIITAWIFAGVFGELMIAGGLVEGLLWFGLETGAQGAFFTVLAFIAAMFFSLGTGSSTATVLALIPVLYPAGVYLGANPTMLAAGILSGAAFGDNLAPVSDTTIVSAYTQDATMNEVVRSRFPLCISAAALTAVILLFTGGGGTLANLPELKATVNPAGLLMFISFAVVVVSALLGRHIVESLIYGNVSAIILGMIGGKIQLSALLHIPEKRGVTTGLIENGIAGVIGPIIFALLVLAITQVLVESGVMDRILKWAEKNIAKTVRQAEASIIFVTILASIPIAANAPALLLVGPSFVKPIGKRFNLAPARRANLMDCAVCTIFFTIPWHIAVIVWYGTLTTASQTWNLPLPSIATAALNPYTWALLGVLIFSVATGWNRKFANAKRQ